MNRVVPMQRTVPELPVLTSLGLKKKPHQSRCARIVAAASFALLLRHPTSIPIFHHLGPTTRALRSKRDDPLWFGDSALAESGCVGVIGLNVPRLPFGPYVPPVHVTARGCFSKLGRISRRMSKFRRISWNLTSSVLTVGGVMLAYPLPVVFLLFVSNHLAIRAVLFFESGCFSKSPKPESGEYTRETDEYTRETGEYT